MALYGGSRDVSLVRHLNRELINDIINTEVIIHKISTQFTKINIYGESTKKVFFAPMRINSLITREDKETTTDDFTSFNRNIRFAFLRDDLKQKNLVIKEGDIIKWDTEYYEINLISGNQLWTGRNPETVPITVDDNNDEYGYNVSIIALGFKTTPDRLNLEKTFTPRTSIYDLPNRI
jgi:hypothetical protein